MCFTLYFCVWFTRYTPLHRTFAIYELDEGHVGRFSFSTTDGLLQVSFFGYVPYNVIIGYPGVLS